MISLLSFTCYESPSIGSSDFYARGKKFDIIVVLIPRRVCGTLHDGGLIYTDDGYWGGLV